MGWFLYDNDFRHERVKETMTNEKMIISSQVKNNNLFIIFVWCVQTNKMKLSEG